MHVSISCGAPLQGLSFERLQLLGQVAQQVISVSIGSSSQLFFSIWPQVSQLADTQARPAWQSPASSPLQEPVLNSLFTPHLALRSGVSAHFAQSMALLLGEPWPALEQPPQ